VISLKLQVSAGPVQTYALALVAKISMVPYVLVLESKISMVPFVLVLVAKISMVPYICACSRI
jgi:hypothetical protein